MFLAVGSNSGRRIDELVRLMLAFLAFEPTKLHVGLALTSVMIKHKTNPLADVETAIMMWYHPDPEDMLLDPLLSVCEWLVAMWKMPSLHAWLESGNTWRELALFTPLDTKQRAFQWGAIADPGTLSSVLDRGATLAGILATPAPRVARPSEVFGSGADAFRAAGAPALPVLRPPVGAESDTTMAAAMTWALDNVIGVSAAAPPAASVRKGRGRGAIVMQSQPLIVSSSLRGQVQRGRRRGPIVAGKPSTIAAGGASNADPATVASSTSATGLPATLSARGTQPATSTVPRGVPNVQHRAKFGTHSFRHAFLDLAHRRDVGPDEAAILNGWFGDAMKRYDKPAAESRREIQAKMSGLQPGPKFMPFPWPTYPDGPVINMPWELQKRKLLPRSFEYLICYAELIVAAAHPEFGGAEGLKQVPLATYVRTLVDKYKVPREPVQKPTRLTAVDASSGLGISRAISSAVPEAVGAAALLTPTASLFDIGVSVAAAAAASVVKSALSPASGALAAYRAASEVSSKLSLPDSHLVGLAAESALPFCLAASRNPAAGLSAATSAARLMFEAQLSSQGRVPERGGSDVLPPSDEVIAQPSAVTVASSLALQLQRENAPTIAQPSSDLAGVASLLSSDRGSLSLHVETDISRSSGPAAASVLQHSAAAEQSPTPIATVASPSTALPSVRSGRHAPSVGSALSLLASSTTFSSLPRKCTTFDDIYMLWHHGIHGFPSLKLYSSADVLHNPWVKSALLDTQVSQRKLVVDEMDRIKREEPAVVASRSVQNIMIDRFETFSKAHVKLAALRKLQLAPGKLIGRPVKATKPRSNGDTPTDATNETASAVIPANADNAGSS